jgi:endonuclease/exonuclease/phosphatase family metal-dependent hydrolase
MPPTRMSRRSRRRSGPPLPTSSPRRRSTPDGAAAVLRSGVLARFPYRVTEIRHGASGIAPLVTVPPRAPGAGRWRHARHQATVVLGNRRLRFYTVHMVAPVGAGRLRWKAQLPRIDEELGRERRPQAAAGDFNATRHHPSFRRLLRHRLADAHERRGRGSAATWPRDRWPLPPLMRLDHVLVTPEVAVQAVREGVGQDSNHRPIIADLALR